MHEQWNHKMFNSTAKDFDDLALQAFNYQYRENAVYKSYVDALGLKADAIGNPEQIPFFTTIKLILSEPQYPISRQRTMES